MNQKNRLIVVALGVFLVSLHVNAMLSATRMCVARASRTVSVLSQQMRDFAQTEQSNSTVVRLEKFFPGRVLDRYMRDFGVDAEDEKEVLKARRLKTEWIRFAIVAKKSNGALSMFSSDVDNMWHTFLLFNKDYELFCKQLGMMLYHVPHDLETQKKQCTSACEGKDKAKFIHLYKSLFDIWPDGTIWNQLRGCNASCLPQEITSVKVDAAVKMRSYSSCGMCGGGGGCGIM